MDRVTGGRFGAETRHPPSNAGVNRIPRCRRVVTAPEAPDRGGVDELRTGAVCMQDRGPAAVVGDSEPFANLGDALPSLDARRDGEGVGGDGQARLRLPCNGGGEG